MFNITINQSSNIDFITIIASVIGALIAGFFSWFATKQAHDNNQKLKDKELKIYEKATALSIAEELKTLLDEYHDEFNKIYSELNGQKYIETNYSLTQDFTTVYTQNAGEIGLIKNEELRKLIIKTYIFLKRYVEDLLIYANDFKDFEKSRTEFIARVYPNLINTACSQTDNTKEIAIIKQKIHINDWGWLNSPFLNQTQVVVFLSSDDKRVDALIRDSENLKKKFYKLKELILDTYNLANKIYKD